MHKHSFGTTVTLVSLILVSSVAQAALIGRLPGTPGGVDFQAYYDTELGITWAANAAIRPPEPSQNQAEVSDFLANTFQIDGIGGWRLPNLDRNGDQITATIGTQLGPTFSFDCASDQLACKDSELMYHYVFNAISWGSPGPFQNVPPTYTRSSTLDYFNNTGGFYGVRFDSGSIVSDRPGGGGPFSTVWAVYDGDVASIAVPEAASAWLFGSGLCLLAWFRRRAT
jgi:hypothetical protein